MTNVSVLTVYLHDEVIGTLTHLPGDRTIFTFTEAYMEDEGRDTLGLSFKDAFGMLRNDFRPYQKQVMPFFSNLLPEGELRRYLAEKADIHPEREFFLLWALGQDLPGAVKIIPEDNQWPPEALSRYEETPRVAEAHLLRFSLAGVQLKFSAIANQKQGLTIPASGVGGDWIVKLPSPQFEAVPENEFSMMWLARELGFAVPPIDLIPMDGIEGIPDNAKRFGQNAFIIKRFDRTENAGPIHMEDFAQIEGIYPHDKYKRANMANLAHRLSIETDLAQTQEFIARMVFNTLIGNGDMHLKNWSLIYPDRKGTALAPAYDFISTLTYIPGDNFALNYSRSKDFSSLNRDELSHFSARAALPEKLTLETARLTTEHFLDLWHDTKAHLPMKTEVRDAIDSHLRRLPLVTGL